MKLHFKFYSLLALAASLSACGGDDDKPNVETDTMAMYRVSLSNVTANQPIAPIAVILHDSHYRGWEIGAPASNGLEMLAESGSPSDFLAEATQALDKSASEGILMPGGNTSLTLMADADSTPYLTIAGMPVHTNDGFSGATMWSLEGLMPNYSVRRLLPVYDAGTEANTESMASIPGPAAGGEGFNAARDDHADVVTIHAGVISADDGLTSSALNSSHRFQQGALYVMVERIQ